MDNTKKITLAVLTSIIVLLITIGISYAYFSANISGTEDDTTITVTGGIMNIIYNGGANISANNISPSNNSFATKNFTVTGNNTTDLDMYYEVILVIEENTFSDNAIQYKLFSTNTNNNGVTIESKNELINIESGNKNISFGLGYFDIPTNGNKVHTYNLKFYFSESNTNQNIDQGKVFKARVEIKGAEKPLPLLTDLIIAQGGGVEAISNRDTPDFSEINGTSGIYSSEDDYGTSYYYRGVKDELNNNLIWAGLQWKIIRINGDGSIKLLYNGTESEFKTNKTVNSTGINTQIDIAAWNLTYNNDAKYVGYMYGGINGAASTMRNGNTSAAATYNETSTNIKLILDNWYKTNIVDKAYSSKVIDNSFCNDRQLQSEVGGGATGNGFGGTHNYYAAYYRLGTNSKPSLKCGLKNDQFTVIESIIGNGVLTYPVGLLTADEASMAGLKWNTINSTNYLYTAEHYWLFTSLALNSIPAAHIFNVYSTGNLYSHNVESVLGVRPVISIDPSSLVKTGVGSASDPFIIK